MNTLLFRNPRLLFLVLGVILAMAATAVTKIGRQEDPTITDIFATIVTSYPGAEPARVESLVTEKIEEELREIPEIDEFTSVSRTGVSVIAVELSMYIADETIEQVWSEIRDALSDAARSFPAGVPEPELDTDRTSAYTAISAIVMRDGLAPNPAIQQRFAETLQDRLRQIPDTKHVRLFGERSEEIRVTVNADHLAALGLSFDQVSSAVALADVKVRAGQLRGSRYDLLVEVEGEIEDLQRIRDVPLGADRDGATLRLSDVAAIERGLADPARELAYTQGRPAVLVAARMENDRQVDAWTAAARAVMTDFESTLPAGLEHRLIFDQNRYTQERFATLGINLAIGVFLVVLVLLVSLGWRAASVVAAAIPLATLMSITAMQWLGLPIQQMSVTGLIVALGLLVDAAIVMSDGIKRRIEAGLPALSAVAQSVDRLAVPLLASTVTTVLAFVPMALLPGPAGDFVGSIALSVIIMLTVSFFLALTVTPALAGRLLGARAVTGTGILQRGITLPGLARLFDRSLDLALRHKGLAILGALVLPLMGFAAFPTLTAQFFPGVDRDQFYIQVSLPGGAAIAETEKLALRIDARLRGRDDIESLHWVIGESAPAFYYNMVTDRDGVPGFAEALVTSTSPAATERLIPELQTALDRDYPQAQILVRGLVQGPPVDAPVELRLVGPNLETLRATGERLRQVMAQVPEVTHTRADLIGAEPKLVFSLDEDKVRLAGLSLGEVARQMEAGLSGALGGSLVEASEELPVRVRLGDDARNRIEALRSLMIVAPGAAEAAANGRFPGIPLAALGTLELVPSNSPITRRNGERVNTVQGFVARGVLPEEALKQVQALLAEAPLTLPPGYRLEYGGDADARAETAGNLAAAAGLVVTLTVITIFLTFGSYRLSLVTFGVAILSMGSSLLALAVFQFPFGIQALIGTIGSIGVSVNAAIIILTALQRDPDAMAGDLAAMRRVVSRSARHIVSTTITTVGGFIPLILAGGGFWPPFAMAIAGGVLLSTVVSFYFTPPLFALVMRRGTSVSVRNRSEAVSAPAATPPAHAAE